MKYILKYKLFLFIIGIIFLQSSKLMGADVSHIMGGGSNQLRINLNASGTWIIYRELIPGNGNWVNQFFGATPVFTIKLGTTSFRASAMTIEDISATTTGVSQVVSKKYTSTYNGNSFSVVINYNYNTSNPNYMTLQAIVGATAIPSGTAISLAYGFDAYVNGCDGGAAITVPNLGYNTVDQSVNLTQAQVQGLRMVGGINTIGSGSLIALFPMGKPFDRAYSAYYGSAYSYSVINSTSNLFKFGPYAVPTCSGGSIWDNGIGVVYDNILAGTTTDIRTGLSFTQDLDGELDYTWNGSKNLVANLGDNINLNLKYTSYNSETLPNVGFKVNLPGLKINSGGCTQSGFNSGNFGCVVGNEYYQLTNGNINSLATGNITVPVQITQCGQWSIDGDAISDMTRTLPLGTPAVLTVKSTVGLASTANIGICKGNSSTITVKLPDGVTPAQAITIALSYAGSTSAFSTLPTSVIIPAGQNSATFTVISNASAADNSSLQVTLASTNQEFATINTSKTVTVNLYNTPTVTNTLNNGTFCPGTSVSGISLTSSVTGATFTWTNTNTSIGLAASGAGNIPTFTAVNTNASPITATIRVTPTANGCVGTYKEYTITVNPTPTVSTVLNNQTYCNNSSSPAITLASGTTGTTYAWTNTDASIGLAASGSGNIPTFTAVNTNASPITATIRVTPTANGCVGTYKEYTITVNPTPTVSTVLNNLTYCNTSSVPTITLASATTGTTYAWTNTNTAIGLAAGGTGNIPMFTAVNTNASPITATIRVTPTANGCVGTYKEYTITVRPIVVSGTISGNPYTCDGDVPQIIKGIETIGGSGAFTYQWQSSANGTTGWTNITGATGVDYAPGVLTQNTYFKRISIDSNCGSFESNVFLITKIAAGINFTWKSNATDHNWNNPANWTNTGGLTDAVPTKCSEVHIPSVSDNYPSLDGNTVTTRFGSPITDKITFHFGGQVAYPHKLTYNKAFIQYNWGYYAGGTAEQPAINAEGTSAKMITREKWYMLAAPLKKMASGDFALGGYPLTWQSLYNAPHPTTGALVEGDFSIAFSSNDIDLATKNNALAVKVACYNAANIGYNDQCHLEGMRGVLEIPYFENSAAATYHPGHVYNKIRKESRFYYFDEKTLQQLASPVGTLARGNEAYRFVFEDAATNKASNIVVDGTTVPGYSQRVSSGTSIHNTIMVGNPFMATINSRLFFEANRTKLKEDAGYYMLTPTNQVWSRYEYRTENKIPALQAIVITLADGLTSADLVYPLEGTYALTEVPNMVHVRTATTLGSSLYIRATSGDDKTSDYAILNTEETGEPSVVSKMIYPASHSITEAFIVSSDQEYNLIDFYKGTRSEVGLGIKSSNQKDVLTLEFENVDAFRQATGFSPVLVDKYLNIEQDLSSNNVYRFNQRKTEADKQYSDVNRFSLRLASETSGIIDETKTGDQVSVTYIMNELEVSCEQGLIQIDVYDLQGRHMHSSGNLTGAPITYSKYLPLNQGVYIVKVKTSLGSTVAKKINAK